MEFDWPGILLYTVLFYIAFKLGEYIAFLKIVRVFMKDPKEFEHLKKIASGAEEQKQDFEALKVEKHGDHIYLYTDVNDEFLAQGKTLQEALDRVEKRFPSRNFKGFLSKEQADNLGVSIK